MLSEAEYRPIPVSMDQDPLQIYRARVELRPADLRALSGATKVIVPGVPGYVIVCVLNQFDRLVGDAYTANGVTAIGIKHEGGTAISLPSVTSFLDATGPANYLQQSGAWTSTVTLTAATIGKPIIAYRAGGTDLSGGTGSVIVTFWYRLFRVPQEGRRA